MYAPNEKFNLHNTSTMNEIVPVPTTLVALTVYIPLSFRVAGKNLMKFTPNVIFSVGGSFKPFLYQMNVWGSGKASTFRLTERFCPSVTVWSPEVL